MSSPDHGGGTWSGAGSGVEEQAQARLQELVSAVRGVRGALVATVDGHAVAAVLRDASAGSTAAIIASSRGLGERLAELCGDGHLEEIVVRSSAGYVVVYTAGSRGVLTVLTDRAANLAMLHLRARDVADAMAALLGD